MEKKLARAFHILRRTKNWSGCWMMAIVARRSRAFWNSLLTTTSRGWTLLAAPGGTRYSVNSSNASTRRSSYHPHTMHSPEILRQLVRHNYCFTSLSVVLLLLHSALPFFMVFASGSAPDCFFLLLSPTCRCSVASLVLKQNSRDDWSMLAISLKFQGSMTLSWLLPRSCFNGHLASK